MTISIIDVGQYIKENKVKGPVTSPQLFMGKSLSFHPSGIFSEEIFGMEGSPDSKNSVSWIELNCKVIHPAVFDMLSKTIERKITPLISNEKVYSVDDKGALYEDPEGEITGLTKFSEMINSGEIKFRKSEEESQRNKVINMINDNINQNTFFMDKLIVISPSNRPVSIGDDQRDTMIDEMNELYTRIIMLANQLTGVAGTMFDVLSYKMQLAIRDIFEFVKTKVAKKQGLIRGAILGKRIDFSARAVITPNPTLRLGQVGIPLPIACGIFEPYLLYGLVNSKEAHSIPDEFHEALKEFLGKEVDPEMIL